MTAVKPASTRLNSFAGNDETPVSLPMSDDEVVIAYSMVAALYRLVLNLSQGGTYDTQARSVMESAERLLLRTDVAHRVLRLAWSERRQEFLVDHIELLEQQKKHLLKTLQPFAQLVEASYDDPDWERHLVNMVSHSDFARAQAVYNALMVAEKSPMGHSAASPVQ